MSHADRPYPARQLAGVDQALGEGRARRPVELLDQLRERLDRLDANHPSASQHPGELDQAQAENVQVSRPECSSQRKEGSGDSRGEKLNDHGAGDPQAVSQAGHPIVDDNAVASLATNDLHRVADARRGEAGERYRPWFADEPGTPWFAEQWFTE